jgi:tetratricopeptide (TPR) repeat protein
VSNGKVEGQVAVDLRTNTISVEVPVQEGASEQHNETRRLVAESLAGMFRDGSAATTKHLAKTPHTLEWAADLEELLEPFGSRVSEEVLRAIQREVPCKDRDTEVQLRRVISRALAARGEVGLALDEIERALALLQPNETTQALALQHTKASFLGDAGDAACPAACRVAAETARALSNHHAAGNLFRIWSMFHWRRREYSDALPLFDAAAEELKHVEGNAYAFHLLDTLERVAGLDRERTRRYANEILEIIDRGNSLTETQTAKARLSIAQHLLSTGPVHAERELARRLAVDALSVFRRFVGYEERAGACASLLSIEYAHRGEHERATMYAADQERWLASVSDDEHLVRALLARCLANKQLEPLFDYEARLSARRDARLYALWAEVTAILLFENGEPERALDLLVEAERRLRARPRDHIHSEVAALYQIRAEFSQKLGDQEHHIASLAEVVRLVPADIRAALQLSLAGLRTGRNELAAREATRVIATEPSVITAYQIAARAHTRLGNYQRAVEILADAITRFPGHDRIAVEHQLVHDLHLGLRTMAKAEADPEMPQPPSTSEPLPEVKRLPEFHRNLAAALLEFVVELQRNPIRPMREQDYVEADFRDAAALYLGRQWSNLHAEPVAANGFVDLQVSDDRGQGRFAAEFKIWGRNDFLLAPEQAIGYSGERDPAAAVLMVNPKQEDISSAYVQQVIVGHPSYVPGTYRRRPLEPQSERLTHFLSQHRDALGRPVSVFHFIVHSILAKPRSKKRKKKTE